MYNQEPLSVLIADDEPRIVQLIQQIIEWEKLNLRCVGIANDGETAKTLINELQPDIFITDIRMPVISGLELAQYICSQELNTQIIIISGYKQFDYAYQALKQGAADFLIKPINGRDLNNVLLRICEKRNSTVMTHAYMEQLREKVEVAEREKRKQVLIDLYNGLPLRSEQAFVWNGHCFFALTVKVDLSNSFNESDLRIMEKISTTLREEFEGKFVDFEAAQIGNLTIALLSVEEEQTEAVYRIAAKGMRHLKNLLDVYAHLMIACGISKPCRDAVTLSECIRESVEAAACCTVLGNDAVIDARTVDLADPGKQLTLQDIKKLRACLETLDVEEMCLFIEEVVGRYRENCHSRPRQLRSLLYELRETIHKQKSMWEDEVYSQSWDSLPFAYERCTALDEMVGALLDAVRDLFKQCEEARQKKNSVPIRFVKEYIEKHLSEDISLDSVANAVGFSKNYLCKLFKVEMNTTIVTYITEARMEAAKKLLKETVLNISEIALQVGFQDPKYFSRQFTRFVGITPKEYRKISSI